MIPVILIVLVAAVVYFIASSKSRRDTAIEAKVRKMVGAGVADATFPNLYYDAAKAYAASKGAIGGDETGTASRVMIDGQVYFVIFTRDSGTSTAMNVQRDEDVTRMILDDFQNM
jgi:hypothetical protein